MSLRIWLPLTKDLRNQGLDDATVTNNGATFNSTGKLGGCYSVDNVKQIGCNNCISLGTTFSIAFWSKINSKNVDWGNIFKIYKDGADYIGMCLAYTTDTNPKLGFHIYRNNGSNAREAVIDGYKEYSLNNWFHTAITVTPTKAIVYKNGEIFNTFTISKSFPSITNYSLWLGKNGIGNGLDCSINDVRIYDHCLSPMEVKELAKGLILHYPLNRAGWGQENLVWNTHWDNMPTSWSNWGSPPTREIVNINGKRWLHVKSSDRWQGYSQNQSNRSGVGEITAGEKLTLSCYAYSTTSLTNYPPIGIHWTDGSSIISQSWPQCNLTTTPQKFVTTLTVPNGVSAFNIMVGNGSGTVSGVYEVWISEVKIERGEIATPWCPNSSDVFTITMGLNSTTEYDCSGFCNNGTRTGTFTWTSDTPKYQVSTIFENNRIMNDSTFLLSQQNRVTLAAWVKLTAYTSDRSMIALVNQFYLTIDSSGRLSGYAYGKNPEGYHNSNSTIPLNKWTHIAIVWDDSNIKFYLNGQLDKSITSTGTSTSTVDYQIRIGQEAANRQVKGNLSDIRAYVTALSDDDIKSLYQNSAYIDNSGNVYGTIHEV